MYYYKCVRCNHITKQKIEIQRHINRKFKCKNTNKYEGNDKDFITTSLIKIFTEENVEELKKENDLKEQINNNETFICSTCNLVFEDKQLYNKHVKNICQNHTTNITNNTLNQQNNVININLKIIRPFDDDWDVSNIDNTLKNILVLSSLKYTKTLEQILNNDTNLNVFIDDKNAETGIVYKNDIEKFKLMTISDIIDKSMNKLHKHLTDFHEEINDNNEYSINGDYLQEEKDIINKKFDEFKNNNMVQEKVQHFLTNIYNSKKEDSLKIFKELMDEQEKDLIEGY
jgi:hypothetical protein